MSSRENNMKTVSCYVCGRKLLETNAKGSSEITCPKCKARFNTNVGTCRLTMEMQVRQFEEKIASREKR